MVGPWNSIRNGNRLIGECDDVKIKIDTGRLKIVLFKNQTLPDFVQNDAFTFQFRASIYFYFVIIGMRNKLKIT